jgi:hypothetical protein
MINYLLTIFIALSFLTGCYKPGNDISKFYDQVSNIEKGKNNKGIISTYNSEDWDYFLICQPYCVTTALNDQLPKYQDVLEEIENSMEGVTYNAIYLLKKEKILRKERIQWENNVTIPKPQGFILTNRKKLRFYYLIPQNNLIYLYDEAKQLEGWKSRESFNNELIQKFQGKGIELHYMQQSPYPDLSTPKNAIRTFLKARKEQNLSVLEKCFYPSKNAKIYYGKNNLIEIETVCFIEMNVLEPPEPIHYKSKIKATRRVIVTFKQNWMDTNKLVDVPYVYYLTQINEEWKIISLSIGLDYGS